VIQTQTVVEKVLVICPFCGAKNEQGMTTCKNCGARI
jgi:ribosomal protein L40E